MDILVFEGKNTRIVPVSALKETVESLDPITGMFWLHLPVYSAEMLAQIANILNFHQTALRECRDTSHVPRMEVFHDHLFAVVHLPMFDMTQTLHTAEMHYFAGRYWLVTVPSPHNQNIQMHALNHEATTIRRRIDQQKFTPKTVVELLHALMAQIGARQSKAVNLLAERIANIEDCVLNADPSDMQGTLEQMFRIRHDLFKVRTMAASMREMYARSRQFVRWLPQDAQYHIEDLTEQFERVRALCDVEKEFLQGLLDFYESRVSTRINFAMERLALLTAIVMPITAVSGIYGMNLIVFPESQGKQLGLVLSMMATGVFLMLRWAKKQGWW